MKFAIPFSKSFSDLTNENIQFNIVYKPKIKQLNDFIQAYGTHRINLIVPNFNIDKDSEIIKTLTEKYPNTQLVVAIPTYTPEIEQALNKLELLHYYEQLITTWDRFQGFLTLNITDIFIAEQLAFSAPILSENAKKAGKALRCYCNICQSSWDRTQSLKTFFIRPQDIDLYAQYFDTFEFYVNHKDINKINVLYNVYSKEKKWLGKLNEIIVGYQGDDYSAFILPRFGEKRLNCGKRCMKNPDTGCHLCQRMAETGEILRQNDFYIRIEND